MFNDVMIAAFREEYNAATPASSRSELGFWRFVAEYLVAYHGNDDDNFFEWIHSIVDKHAAAILAHNPELSKDEVLMDIYFDDWDFEA